MNHYKNIANGFALTLVAAFMSSCADSNNVTPSPAGERTVTVNFITESPVVSRAADTQNVISAGSQIDVLVYAVYDDKGTLLDYFQTNGGIGADCPDNFTPGTGQNAIGFKAGQTGTIVLKVNPDLKYQIACWAQSSKCDAYDSSDLSKVTVDYSDAVNNDEKRDAFCTVSEVFSGSTTEPVTLTLRRPFAQINVGTTGADFKMSARIPGGTYYTYSSVSLKGVSESYDVLKGEAAEETTTATFELNKIASYWNMDVPTADADKVMAEGEDFLKVNLDGEDGYTAYKTSYPTIDEDGTYLTETFKYMSMCYILVPGANGTSLDEVTFLFSGDSEGTPTTSVNTSFSLPNVPAKKNYRTNILGGLSKVKPSKTPDPDGDDDDEIIDDPTTLFNSVKANVTINVEYLGDNDPIILQ